MARAWTLDENRAIVVRLSEERWLRLVPRDSDAALEAGYFFVGNLHWRVRFEPGVIAIALEVLGRDLYGPAGAIDGDREDPGWRWRLNSAPC